MNIRHYYSTLMLQRRKLVKGIFSSLTFYPCWNKSKYPMFFVFRGDTGTSTTVSCCQSQAIGSNVMVLDLLFTLLSMSWKHRLYSSLPQLTVQPNCTISAGTQLNTLKLVDQPPSCWGFKSVFQRESLRQAPATLPGELVTLPIPVPYLSMEGFKHWEWESR